MHQLEAPRHGRGLAFASLVLLAGACVEEQPSAKPWKLFVDAPPTNLVVISIYLIPYDSEINTKTLYEVESIISILQCMWVIYGDFNREHSWFIDAQFGPAINGHIINLAMWRAHAQWANMVA